MHAVVMHERGGPEVLVHEVVPRPAPDRGELLVRVLAATVNHTDLFHRSGRFFIHKELPHILGMDVVGEVEAAGDGVARWRRGDRVAASFEALGRARDGAYAEFTTIPAGEARRVPPGLAAPAAAAVGLAFTTAWIALVDRAAISHGESVVVHAASSGVGAAAVQISRWKNATVVAVSDPSKGSRLRALGASAVVDRHSGDLPGAIKAALGGRGATLVVELVGRDTLQSSIDVLADYGRIVCIGTLSGDVAEVDIMDVMMRNLTIMGSFGVAAPEAFEHVLELHARGTFEPVIDSILPLSRAAEAHERIEARAAFGKVVLVPDSVQGS